MAESFQACLKSIIKITALINGIFSIIFEALYWLKLGLNFEAKIQILNYAALPGQTSKTARVSFLDTNSKNGPNRRIHVPKCGL